MFGATVRLESTGIAVELAGAIAHHAVFVDERGRGAIDLLAQLQLLSGRAEIDVRLMIVSEGGLPAKASTERQASAVPARWH